MKFNRRLKLTLALFTTIIVTVNAIAQESTGTIYSPYSLYGLGVLGSQGNASVQSMSGLSIATKNPFTVSTANPAAYSVAPAKTMLFSFGMQGSNEYFKAGDKSTSHNDFNLSDLSAQFPIAEKLGFAFSFSPYSSVGYDMEFNDYNPDVTTDIGQITYNYYGNGGLAVIKGGFGWEPIKGLSVGANFIYYFGSISRASTVSFYPIVAEQTDYRSIYRSADSHLAKLGGEIGIQYDIDLKYNRYITLGAVFTPRLNTEFEEVEYIQTSGADASDFINTKTTYPAVTIPTKISTGIAYRTSNTTVGLDYIYQDWNDAFEVSSENIRLTSMQEVRVGFEYLPNKYDLRNHLKRWTYRMGVKASNSYLMHNNEKINEYSGSFGLGIPLQRGGGSLLNIGIEGGYRGSVGDGAIKENFLKINVGVSLFTINEWFRRHRFK